MVVVPKPSGSLHICIDFKPLNQSVLREVCTFASKGENHSGPTRRGEGFFKNRYKQLFLANFTDSLPRLLTTFLIPFGRFCYNRLPFGIASAPEHFQRRMDTILECLSGVLCLIDNILINGRDQLEHDERLRAIFLAI